MAKFKVGDRVRFTAGPIKGEYGRIISLGRKNGCYDVQSAYGEILTNTPEGELARNSTSSTNPVVQNALAARNAGWAMISREGGKWYYAWADGSSNGTEGPFRSEDEATIAAKQDGFKIKNSSVATNADTEASIEAEAKKLAKEVLAIASKYDALQKRLNKIGVYYTDYQAAANDLRNVHSVLS